MQVKYTPRKEDNAGDQGPQVAAYDLAPGKMA
jgi:hypothetical protein